MRSPRRLLLQAVVIATLATTAVAVSTGTADANTSPFTQSWNSADHYRASIDFVPYSNGELWVGGKGCNASYVQFWVNLVRTSDKKTILDTKFYHEANADGAWHWLDDHEVSSGTAYYLRWNDINDAEPNQVIDIPCQGVEAKW